MGELGSGWICGVDALGVCVLQCGREVVAEGSEGLGSCGVAGGCDAADEVESVVPELAISFEDEGFEVRVVVARASLVVLTV